MTSSGTRPSARARRTVFYSVAAQWDNLGDIEIRNAALSWIRATGSDVVAFSGTMPTPYLDAFEIDASVRFVSNPVRYQMMLWTHLLKRRASIVFAPGPQVFGPSARAIGKSVVNLINVCAVRASGGAVLAVGRSLRGRGRLARVIEAAVVSRFQLYVVRDTRSAVVLGQNLDGAPDLAFAHEFRFDAGNDARNDVILSLRGDRPISIEGLGNVIGQLRQQGLRPLVVTQVKRDDEQHRELAREFDLPAILWDDHTHVEQLDRARSAYANAGAVISNRLHALIFGIQHGAAPIAVLDHASDKLTSTLRPWVTLRTTTPAFDLIAGGPWEETDIAGPAGRVVAEAELARAALERVRQQFTGLLDERDATKLAEAHV